LVGKSKRKRLVGKPRCNREDNVRMDLREIVFEGVECVHLA